MGARERGAELEGLSLSGFGCRNPSWVGFVLNSGGGGWRLWSNWGTARSGDKRREGLHGQNINVCSNWPCQSKWDWRAEGEGKMVKTRVLARVLVLVHRLGELPTGAALSEIFPYFHTCLTLPCIYASLRPPSSVKDPQISYLHLHPTYRYSNFDALYHDRYTLIWVSNSS